jgi:hypothetical protein
VLDFDKFKHIDLISVMWRDEPLSMNYSSMSSYITLPRLAIRKYSFPIVLVTPLTSFGVVACILASSFHLSRSTSDISVGKVFNTSQYDVHSYHNKSRVSCSTIPSYHSPFSFAWRNDLYL